MGKIILSDRYVDLEGLDPDFYYNKIKPWISSLSFDTIATSGYRSAKEKQAAMYKEYLEKLEAWKKKYPDQSTKEAQAARPSAVNPPGLSAHNYGLAIDIHPVTYLDKDYDTMLKTAKDFGIIRDKKEKWHFQDENISLAKMQSWLKENPGAASGVGVLVLILFIIGAYLTIRN